MKSLKKTLLVAVCALSFASCSQQSEITPTQEAKKVVKPRRNDKSGGNLTFYKYGNWAECLWPSTNCLPEVVLRGGGGSLTTLFSTLETGTEAQVRQYFIDNYTDLSEYILTPAMDGVIDRSLKASLSHNENNATVYVVFENVATNAVYEAYPFLP